MAKFLVVAATTIRRKNGVDLDVYPCMQVDFDGTPDTALFPLDDEARAMVAATEARFPKHVQESRAAIRARHVAKRGSNAQRFIAAQTAGA